MRACPLREECRYRRRRRTEKEGKTIKRQSGKRGKEREGRKLRKKNDEQK